MFFYSRVKNLYKTEKNLRSKFGKNRIFASKCDCGSISDLNNLKKKITKDEKIDIVIANVGDGRRFPYTSKTTAGQDLEKILVRH